MLPPHDGDTWVGLSDGTLSMADASAWVARPDCGAVVVFTGDVRNHADGRSGVSALEYEAYIEQVAPRLEQLVTTARQTWPSLGRVVCLHRVGKLDVGDHAVIVAVSAPHRGDAFEAARWCIDTLKATVPIWKRETWEGGVGWGTGDRQITEVGS